MKINLSAIKLAVYNLPLFRDIRVQGEKVISYGELNTYPAYLIDNFNQCAVHNAIITAKVNYITGRGLEIDKPNPLFTKPNGQETTEEIWEKSVTDYELLNGYAYEVVKKGTKIDSFFHMDFARLRKSADDLGYWYSNEWTYLDNEGQRLKKLNPLKIYFPKYKTGEEQERSILYIAKYRPDFEFYPLPDYVGANSAIETAVEIDNYHLNNIKNGFSAGALVSLNNGVPETPEERKDIVDELKKGISGTNQAGSVLVSFSTDKDHAPEFTPMQSNDLDKKYEQLASHVQDTKIGRAHV